MNIKTKFNINQEVFFMKDDSICFRAITKIEIVIFAGHTSIITSINYCFYDKIEDKYVKKDESLVFKSKEELLKSL